MFVNVCMCQIAPDGRQTYPAYTASTCLASRQANKPARRIPLLPFRHRQKQNESKEHNEMGERRLCCPFPRHPVLQCTLSVLLRPVLLWPPIAHYPSFA